MSLVVKENTTFCLNICLCVVIILAHDLGGGIMEARRSMLIKGKITAALLLRYLILRAIQYSNRWHIIQPPNFSLSLLPYLRICLDPWRENLVEQIPERAFKNKLRVGFPLIKKSRKGNKNYAVCLSERRTGQTVALFTKADLICESWKLLFNSCGICPFRFAIGSRFDIC